MPNLEKGTEGIKFLLSQASKDMFVSQKGSTSIIQQRPSIVQ